MATMELPPRKSGRFQEVTISRNRSSLEVLMQMGFPKHRAEKALAATGDKGVQLASDWLLSHVNDPALDERAPRDYILYLCPVGPFQQQLLEFWQKSYSVCGWNRAHNYFPHITLCSFFKAEDSIATSLAHAMKTVGEKLASQSPKAISMEYFTSTNFIGLFVSESCSPFLREVTQEMAEEAKKFDVTVEPHKKQLHVSLAYQFPTNMKEKIEALTKDINPRAPVRWDIRLYSRDCRMANCQVRKVIYTHTPRAPDELELIDGDFIYLEESEIEKSPDGWYKGTSWLTGCTGMFPGNYTERTAESGTWTLHRSIPVIGADSTARLVDPFSMLTPELTPVGVNRVIEENRRNHAFTTAILRGTETLPPRLPEMTTIRSAEMNGPLTADNILYATVGDSAVVQPLVSGNLPTQSASSQNLLYASQVYTSLQSPLIPEPKGSNQTNGPSSSGSSHSPPQSATSSASQTTPTHSQSTAQSSSSSSQSSASSARTNENRRSGTPTGSPRPSRHKMASNMSPKLQRRSTAGPSSSASSQSLSYHNNESSKSSSRGDTYQPLSRPSSDPPRPARPQGPRQLYVIRHGERVDFTFGKDWIQQSFDPAGNYIRHDLNMPRTLPRRKGGPSDFSKDPPLTVQGTFQATVIGEALKEKDVPISHVYASPSLRCVETATSILQSMGLEREIHLEPGLFEWLGWYTNGLPRFMSAAEFREAGFNISHSYTPVCPFSRYNLKETTEQYYERCHKVTEEILKKHESDAKTKTILFVAHKGSPDVCTRRLLGKSPRTRKQLKEVLDRIPYCALISIQQDPKKKTWHLAKPAFPSFAHAGNQKYSWKIWN